MPRNSNLPAIMVDRGRTISIFSPNKEQKCWDLAFVTFCYPRAFVSTSYRRCNGTVRRKLPSSFLPLRGGREKGRRKGGKKKRTRGIASAIIISRGSRGRQSAGFRRNSVSFSVDRIPIPTDKKFRSRENYVSFPPCPCLD